MPRASLSYGSPTVAVQQYPAHLSSLKTVHRTVFLTLRPSRVQVLIKKEPHFCDSFLLAGAEGLGLACRLGRCFCILRMQRSPPETCTPRHAPHALVQDLFLQKTDTFRHPFLSWQGQKDLNPRHVVLETTALPTELYPYIKLVGHQGLEPRTDRL